jgi:hypothetical protein
MWITAGCLSEVPPSLSSMDLRTRETGRRLLSNYYDRQQGLVAFIDESTRGRERDQEFPFYILSAVIFRVEQLKELRAELVDSASGPFWHTTESYKHRDYSGIRRMSEAVANSWSSGLVALQVDIPEGNLELARRESLIQLSSLLLEIDCRLAIYEKRNTRALDAGDASVLNLARRDGWLRKGLALVGSRPAIEPLLWSPDLLCWGFRQLLTRRDSSWLRPFRQGLDVLDVSEVLSRRNEKRPETAAARNSGPVLPADQVGDRASRSSSKSMHHYQLQLQAISPMLPKLVGPGLPPDELRSWLEKTFPH